MSGIVVNAIGFPAMLVTIAILSFLYAPLMFLLKNPPAKEENLVIYYFRKYLFRSSCVNVLFIFGVYFKSLIDKSQQSSIRYVSYQNDKSNDTISENDDY